jgi:hypothetical protein
MLVTANLSQKPRGSALSQLQSSTSPSLKHLLQLSSLQDSHPSQEQAQLTVFDQERTLNDLQFCNPLRAFPGHSGKPQMPETVSMGSEN